MNIFGKPVIVFRRKEVCSYAKVSYVRQLVFQGRISLNKEFYISGDYKECDGDSTSEEFTEDWKEKQKTDEREERDSILSTLRVASGRKRQLISVRLGKRRKKPELEKLSHGHTERRLASVGTLGSGECTVTQRPRVFVDLSNLLVFIFHVCTNTPSAGRCWLTVNLCLNFFIMLQ